LQLVESRRGPLDDEHERVDVVVVVVVVVRLPATTTTTTTCASTPAEAQRTMDPLLAACGAVAALVAHRVKSPDGKLSEDSDPLKWTAVEVFGAVPAVCGLAGVAGWATGATGAAARAWARAVATHSLGELLRGTYALGIAFYFGVGGAVLALDLLRWPKRLYDLKIQKRAVVRYDVMLPRLAAVLAVNNLLPLLAFLVLPRAAYLEREAAVARAVAKFVRVPAALPSVTELTLHTWGFLAVRCA